MAEQHRETDQSSNATSYHDGQSASRDGLAAIAILVVAIALIAFVIASLV
jgi:hypothetical protein